MAVYKVTDVFSIRFNEFCPYTNAQTPKSRHSVHKREQRGKLGI